MRPFLVAILTLAAAPVAADEGELYVGGGAALEAAIVRHPLAHGAQGLPQLAPASFVPRLLVNARYGVTNELLLGLGVDAGAATNVATDDVVLGGTRTRLVTGTLLEAALPIAVAWRVDSGSDLSATVIAELAPMGALWSATAATDPTKLSADGLARRLPLDVADVISLGAHGRVQLAFDARIFGTFGMRMGVYAGVAWAGSTSLRLGVILEPLWIASPGPP